MSRDCGSKSSRRGWNRPHNPRDCANWAASQGRAITRARCPPTTSQRCSARAFPRRPHSPLRLGLGGGWRQNLVHSGGEFIRETRREVEAYLAAPLDPPLRLRQALRQAPGGDRFDGRSPGVCSCSPRRVPSDPASPSPALIPGRDPHRLLHPARCQPRGLLPYGALQPSPGLVGGRTSRSLELLLAQQAQRRAPHLHERRRARRGHHADADRQAGASPAREAVVPLPAPLHLAALQLHGARLQTIGDFTTFRRGRIALTPCTRRAAGISPGSSWAS